MVCFLGENSLIDEANRQPPHKIDENMWKNREQMEEILFLLQPSRWPVQVNLCFVMYSNHAASSTWSASCDLSSPVCFGFARSFGNLPHPKMLNSLLFCGI